MIQEAGRNFTRRRWGRLSEPAWVTARVASPGQGRFGEAAPPVAAGVAREGAKFHIW
jgi:hypothetical protein